MMNLHKVTSRIMERRGFENDPPAKPFWNRDPMQDEPTEMYTLNGILDEQPNQSHKGFAWRLWIGLAVIGLAALTLAFWR